MKLNVKSASFSLFTIILTVCLFHNPFAYCQIKVSNIAVSDFELIGGFEQSEQWYAKAFTEGITNGLSNLTRIRILERSNLEKVTKEISLQLSGIISEESTVVVGKLLGADKIIIGSLTKFGEMLQVNCRTVDVETGQIINALDQKGKASELFSLQNKMLKKLINYFVFSDSTRVVEIDSDMDNRYYQTILNIRELVASFPVLSLDPNRKRNAVKYMMSLNKLEKISEKYPNLSEPIILSAMFLMQLEDFNAAKDQLKLAQSIHPDKIVLKLVQAKLHYLSKNYSEAENNINHYLKLNTNDAHGWYIYAKTCLKLNQEVKAATGFLNTLLNTPYIYKAETNLKTLLRSSKSQYIIDKIAEEDKTKSWLAQLFLAYWDKQGKKIFQLLDDTNYLDNHFYLSQFLIAKRFLKSKNYDQAIPAFQSALKLNPSFTATHKYLGIALIEHNNIELGKNHLRSYLVLADHIDDFSLIDRYLNR